jgi:hypothetical protein
LNAILPNPVIAIFRRSSGWSVCLEGIVALKATGHAARASALRDLK